MLLVPPEVLEEVVWDTTWGLLGLGFCTDAIAQAAVVEVPMVQLGQLSGCATPLEMVVVHVLVCGWVVIWAWPTVQPVVDAVW